ncbi:hypothetical protein FOA43_000669 [Brettanomyces nanus]|uniref:Ribosomal RNA-processing protein 43 n=1 Tax=Eeniella nana TaxID=13502 RepID=A0A875S0F3_EENNA|nr:uncharacterized protein FOA43_000669 [Brettanomyces nanus]QPG73359.1 hypothetical protein FOA43_000669 [Brettanomyces nanus]
MTDTHLRSIKFAPSKLALIAPDVTLKRYIEIGLRPSLRKFHEFRPVIVSPAGFSRYEKEGKSSNAILGSSVVKSGSTDVICSISAGVVEDSQELTNDYRLRLDKDIIEADEDENNSSSKDEDHRVNQYSSVYSVVEVSRGRNGPPTSEEIELSQALYETILHSGMITKESLNIKLGLKSRDSEGKPVIIRRYDSDDSDILNEFAPKKNFSYVLYAKIQVYSKTGPLFDLCYAALIKALRNTKLPEMYINEKETDAKVSALRARKTNKNDSNGRNGSDLQEFDLLCDPVSFHDLKIDEGKLSWSSTFGITHGSDSVLLADPEGEAEENIFEGIEVVSSGNDTLFSAVITGNIGEDDHAISKDQIKEAILLSKRRSANMIKEL